MCRAVARRIAQARGSALWRLCPIFNFKIPMSGRLILLYFNLNSKTFRWDSCRLIIPLDNRHQQRSSWIRIEGEN
jgi:hypothetical protein